MDFNVATPYGRAGSLDRSLDHRRDRENKAIVPSSRDHRVRKTTSCSTLLKYIRDFLDDLLGRDDVKMVMRNPLPVFTTASTHQLLAD